MLSTNEPKMKFSCSKCDKSYASKRALVNHNEKVPFCNVIQTHTDTDNKYDTLVKKVDILTDMVSTLLHIINDMKSHITTPVLSSIVVEQQIKTNEPIVPVLSPVVLTEQIKTNNLTEEDRYIERHTNLDALDIRRIRKNGLKKYLAIDDDIAREQAEQLELDAIEKDKELCLLVQSQQEKTNEPLSSIAVVEQPKTNPIKKVKKVKKQATEPKKIPPKFTYLPNTDDRDYADADQDPQQDICDELKTYLDNLQRDKPDKKPPIQMIHDTLFACNFGLFYDGDGGKIIIDDEYVPYFIDKCSTLEGQEAYYYVLLKSTFNPDMGIYLDTETNKLYHINEHGLWDWSETTFINQVRCALFDTLGSAIANSAVAYKDHTSKLFAIKRFNYNGELTDEINERLLEFIKICFRNFTWNK